MRIRGTTGQQEVPDSSDSGDTDVNPGSQEENLGNQGEHPRSQAEILDDELIEPTLVIASLTLSYWYDNDSPEPKELENKDPPHFHVNKGRYSRPISYHPTTRLHLMPPVLLDMVVLSRAMPVLLITML